MKPRTLPSVMFVLLALFYPIGEILQRFVHSTPRFIRFHMSDLGFVPYNSLKALLLWMVCWMLGKTTLSKLSKWMTVGLSVSFVIAMATEFWGRTDWIDVACYIVGYWLGLALLPKSSPAPLTNNGGHPARFKEQRSKVTRKTKPKPRRR